jgi:hypothetical protein
VSTEHGQEPLLGAYVLGILDHREQRDVENHVAACVPCRTELTEIRAMEEMLGTVPPEAFLEGPPEDGELLLQRTLRQARQEDARAARRTPWTVGLTAAASAAVLFIGGYLTASTGSQTGRQAAGPTTQSSRSGKIMTASATDPSTGARASVRLTPKAGWVQLSAQVVGIPQGEHCRLVVVTRDGTRETAGSWVVPPSVNGKVVQLDGSAAVDPLAVAAVLVENAAGKGYVDIRL